MKIKIFVLQNIKYLLALNPSIIVFCKMQACRYRWWPEEGFMSPGVTELFMSCHIMWIQENKARFSGAANDHNHWAISLAPQFQSFKIKMYSTLSSLGDMVITLWRHNEVLNMSDLGISFSPVRSAQTELYSIHLTSSFFYSGYQILRPCQLVVTLSFSKLHIQILSF